MMTKAGTAISHLNRKIAHFSMIQNTFEQRITMLHHNIFHLPLFPQRHKCKIQILSHIYNMQKIRSLQTSHQDECQESQASSPSRSSGLSLRGSLLKNAILLVAVLMLVSCGGALRLDPEHEQVHDQSLQISNPSNFDFLVFCPATDDDFKPISGPADKRPFRIEFNPKDIGKYLKGRTFIIRAESTLKNGNLVLQYCGRLRTFNQYCNQSIYGCTSGPMFDIEARKAIDVIWINNINSSNQLSVEKAKNTCMDPTFEPHKNYCSLKCKTRSTMTFNEPTIHPDTNTSSMRISYTTWPISTHVHGAEVRPAFDGNPLSWNINNPKRKQFGVGMFSLSEKCYFDSFEKGVDDFNPPIIKIKDNKGQPIYNFKVNRYPNKQNPGTLWYHDHAMRLTNFNVQYGLAGFYILRDTNVQKYLGIARENERFILITNRAAQKYDLDGLVAGTVYRFRILNANYEGRATFRYSFSYNKCNKDAPDLEKFTIIGADSSLFDYGIENQTHFVVSNGERIDLIIKLGEGRSSFSVCGDTDIDTLTTPALITKSGIVLEEAGEMSVYNIKAISLKGYDKGLDKNTRTDINNIDLSPWVAYTDLSEMPDEEISVKRFRPLMGVGTTDTINGRIDFHQGFSENPVIGSTEDWYMINAFPYGHPMHIHLINFQVIKIFKLLVLKSAAGTCSFYELDYVLEALDGAPDTDADVAKFKANIYGTDQNGEETVNYNYTCDNINAIKTNYAVIKQLSVIYPENEVDDNGISGLDLFVKDENDQYKYVVDGEGTVSPKAGYSKWKDTVYIDGFKVLQCRTRWTKPEYKQEVDAPEGSYFHVPADQMREYPGFVYHCHILPHEDNEMMRPIMLQMPDDGRQIQGPCPQLKWEDKVECINKRCAGPVKA